MVFVDVGDEDAFMVVLSVELVMFIFSVVLIEFWVVLLELGAADMLLKFKISVNPNNKISVNTNFCLILKTPKACKYKYLIP